MVRLLANNNHQKSAKNGNIYDEIFAIISPGGLPAYTSNKSDTSSNHAHGQGNARGRSK